MTNQELTRRSFIARLAALGLVACAGGGLAACGGARNATSSSSVTGVMSVSADSGVKSAFEPGKILVADFSYTGNTWSMAQKIAEVCDAQTFRIEAVDAYPSDIDATYDRARSEQSSNAMPEVKGSVEDFASYNTVFLGYPLWWSDVPQVVKSFISQYDWSGKTVIPFSSHSGGGWSNTPTTIQGLCKGAALLTGVTYEDNKVASSLSELEPWLKNIGCA